MNKGRTVFAQILDFLPQYEFDKCVARYHGNFRVRKLPAYEQFLVLAFALLTWRESLCDIETCLASFGPKLYHAGIRQPTARSTLTDANKNGTGAFLPTSPRSSSSKPPHSTRMNRSVVNSKNAHRPARSGSVSRSNGYNPKCVQLTIPAMLSQLELFRNWPGSAGEPQQHVQSCTFTNDHNHQPDKRSHFKCLELGISLGLGAFPKP
jgi:hypothetical protein